MHTMQVRTDKADYIVHHNGNFSGDVEVMIPVGVLDGFNGSSAGEAYLDMTESASGAQHVGINIPFEVLKEVVAEYMRQSTIVALGNADADEMLFNQWTVIPLDT